MLNNAAARRVALAGTVLGVVLATGACGAKPTASVGEPVILAVPAPEATPALPPTVAVTDPSPSPAPEPNAKGPMPAPINPTLVEQAAAGVEPNTTLGAVVFDRVSGRRVAVGERRPAVPVRVAGQADDRHRRAEPGRLRE